jgi:hypothetical protein
MPSLLEDLRAAFDRRNLESLSRAPAEATPVPPASPTEYQEYMRRVQAHMEAAHRDAQRMIDRPVVVGYDITTDITTDRTGPAPANRIAPAPATPRTAKEPTTLTPVVVPGLDPEFTDEYRTLAAELGINTAPIDTATFHAWLSAQGLRVYHYGEVQEYLHAQYKVPVGNITPLVVWGWRPLRAVDQIVNQARSLANGSLQPSVTPYAKPIPYPVLRTVKAVRDAFPAAHFFVSDEMQAEQIPDPFLLVELGGKHYVIERWNEPAFRATK